MTAQDPALHLLDSRRLPVVLLGGINLVRTLGLARLQTIVATSDLDEPALASRYCALRVLLPPPDQHDARIEALAKLGERLAAKYGRRVPIMYGSDEALQMLHTQRTRLQRYFLMLLNAPEVAEALIAKDRFQEFAEARALPVPRALTWADGPSGVRSHQGPVIVKPRAKHHWHETVLCQRLFDGDGKARVYSSGAELRADPEAEAFNSQLQIQEYVPGGDEELWSYHGFADECSQVIASFIGRKVRTYPVDMGESAYIELAYSDALEQLGRDVVRRCPLRGPFKMDFKRDPATGRFHLLEINARYTLWHLLGAMNGMNLMRVAYDYMLQGERPTKRRWRSAYRWLSLDLDFRAYKQLAGAKRMTLARWLASLAFSSNVYALFSWSDPMPWLGIYLQRARRATVRGGVRLFSLMRPWRSTAS